MHFTHVSPRYGIACKPDATKIARVFSLSTISGPSQMPRQVWFITRLVPTPVARIPWHPPRQMAGFKMSFQIGFIGKYLVTIWTRKIISSITVNVSDVHFQPFVSQESFLTEAAFEHLPVRFILVDDLQVEMCYHILWNYERIKDAT